MLATAPNFTALQSEIILAFLILAWLAAALWALAHQCRSQVSSFRLPSSPLPLLPSSSLTPPASADAACKLPTPVSPPSAS